VDLLTSGVTCLRGTAHEKVNREKIAGQGAPEGNDKLLDVRVQIVRASEVTRSEARGGRQRKKQTPVRRRKRSRTVWSKTAFLHPEKQTERDGEEKTMLAGKRLPLQNQGEEGRRHLQGPTSGDGIEGSSCHKVAMSRERMRRARSREG